ncbi:MAG: lytic transglycosylase domain-containing protein [Deltaproteobacteria bacterium]
MTIGINENQSLLASMLARETKGQAGASALDQSDSQFADKLDGIMAADGKGTRSEQAKKSTIAEILHLQMLHTQLNLAGDTQGESKIPSLFNRQSPSIQSLVQAYAANLQEGGEPASQQDSPIPEPLTESTSSSRTSSNTSTTRGTEWLDPIISKASRRYGVDVSLIKAVIKAESNFNPNAVSHAGARGLMQLMPGTARSLGVSDSFDPEQNVMGGTKFLRDLLDRYNGDLDSAIAAYNWGPGNVDKRSGRMPAETRGYLARVKQLYSSYST